MRQKYSGTALIFHIEPECTALKPLFARPVKRVSKLDGGVPFCQNWHWYANQDNSFQLSFKTFPQP
jgi:hypothetical protein